MTGAGQTSKTHALFLLATLSGACGIAYEIIYIRLISNYFGSDFAITATVLSAVFFGMALGAWQSVRLVRYLPWIEIALGLFAFALASVFALYGYGVVSFGGIGLGVTLGKLVLLLVVPAFLIGTCVPLFTSYVDGASAQTGSRFTLVYTLYNLGAFASGLLIEFVLFRKLGLTLTTCIIGSLNLFVGCSLLAAKFGRSVVAASRIPKLDRPIAAALFAAAIVSGVFQLYVLKVSYAIFGSYQENFAIVLVTALLGLFIGAALTRRAEVSIVRSLVFGAALMGVYLLSATPAVYAWSWIQSHDLPIWALTGLKVVLLGGPPLPVFVVFGMTVPLAAKAHGVQKQGLHGALLAIASLGNGVGALLMMTVLFEWVPLRILGPSIAAGLLVVSILLVSRRSAKRPLVFGTALVSVLLVTAALIWPSAEIAMGYRTIAIWDQLKSRAALLSKVDETRRLDQSARLVSFKDEEVSLILNGYESVRFGPDYHTPLHEAMVGSASALFSKRTDKALVFGLGSGVTAGAAAEIYEIVTVVEINPTLLEYLPHFADVNGRVQSKPNVDIQIADGVKTLIASNESYDTIVSTVMSPHYYASSKLYTADFYALVRSRLREGGVYSSWFDLTIGLEGIDYLLNTLESSFAECHYTYLNIGYFNAVCGGEPLSVRPRSETSKRYESPMIAKAMAESGVTQGYRDFLLSLEMKFDERVHQRQSSEISTLDRPVLEFVIARTASDKNLSIELFGIVDRSLKIFKQEGNGLVTFMQRCTAFEVIDRSAAPNCPGDPRLNTAQN